VYPSDSDIRATLFTTPQAAAPKELILVNLTGIFLCFKYASPLHKDSALSFPKLFILLILTILLFSTVSYSATSDITASDLLARMKAQQALITDMQADTKTTITSNLSMPGQTSKGPQTMTQTGHIWTKGKDRSKTEITSPMQQTTITNGNIMTIIDPSSGRKITQDMSKLPGAGGKSMDPEKALDYFDLSVTESGSTEYVLSGTPKQANQFLGRMDFFIDGARNVPVRIAMYTPKGALMSLSEMEYEPIVITSTETAYVATKVKSIVTMQIGSVNSEMEYENIKVNEGIEDKEFEAN
jgi:outer membrane lipoprotein-sorting protein